MSLNRVTLIGRMVRDPELRTTNTGKNVVEFSIAVDKRIKPQDPNAPSADFFRCKAWNQSADYLGNYAAKGRLIAVDGRLESRKYVDKGGNNREAIEVVADNVSLLDRPAEGQGDGSGASAAPQTHSGQATRPASPAAEYDPFADE